MIKFRHERMLIIKMYPSPPKNELPPENPPPPPEPGLGSSTVLVLGTCT